MCACCGTAMEQNEPDRPVIAREYCAFCGREPLCAACSNFIIGMVGAYDVGWGRLTYRAAGAIPRTAAGPERAELVICCRCRGGIYHRTEQAEQPIALGPYTQDGVETMSQVHNNEDRGARWLDLMEVPLSRHLETPPVVPRGGQLGATTRVYR